MLDLVIKNGRIVDGTGNPWFFGDIGVKDGIITHVGKVEEESLRTIDAQWEVVAPGFIDGHCHSDLLILDRPLCDIKLQQGVTTEVVGNCGLAPAPCFPETADLLRSYVEPVIGKTEWKWPWRTIEEYMSELEKAQSSGNAATYVAHGALRIAVMGFAKRPATPAELDRMKALLEEGMRAGAIGLSIGLLYAPGSYAPTEEIAELCKIVAKYDGLLATHIRGEGNNLLPSVREVVRIAEQSGVSLHVSHLKAAGKINWGKTKEAMEIIDDAQNRGMDVTCDAYPYSAGSTTLTTLLPPWTLEGGIRATLSRLKDTKVRKKIKDELREEQRDWDNLVVSTGWQSVYVSAVASDNNKRWEGKHMLEIGEALGIDPEDAMMNLLLEEDGNVSIVYFHMSDKDVAEVIRYDKSLVASDSLGCVTGKPHPRTYGTFPRLFAKYVREERALSLEQAVRKVTSFPARRFKLGQRGLIVPGYRADLVIFDPQSIADTATYEEPQRLPEGIAHVLVGGISTVERQKHTGVRSGVFVRACHCHARLH